MQFSSLRVLIAPFPALLLAALSLSGYKLYLLELASRGALGCSGCLLNKAMFHELQFLLLFSAIHLASNLFRAQLPRLLLRSAVVAVLLIAAIDLVVFQQFQVRFTLAELLKFIGEYGAVANHLQQLLSSTERVLLTASLVSMALLLTVRYLRHQEGERGSKPALLMLFATASAGAGQLIEPDFHTPYLNHAIEAFFSSQSRDRPYSTEFGAALPAAAHDDRHCHEALGAKRNLILVVMESLSMYHSQRFSALNDWTPYLDLATENGKRFTHFYANGIRTMDGLVALFTGEPPLPKTDGEGDTLFEQFSEPKNSLPRLLNGLGYRTLFLTTGNLGFQGKGKWLERIGFHYVEGHDARFYDGKPRFHFDAAADQALYERALQLIDKPAAFPFFMALETVSTHHPHIDPSSGERSEERTFRYADRSLGKFLDELKQRHFFDNGHLIITSDHRAMLPMRPDEFALYGDRAYARVPLAIIGPNMRGEITAAFSQSDLLPSLHHWLGKGRACIDRNQGIFLPTPLQEPECIYTRRSYDPNQVIILCGEERYAVELDGDASRYVDSSGGSPKLLEQLHRLRLGRGY